jgi:hypothetical protein
MKNTDILARMGLLRDMREAMGVEPHDGSRDAKIDELQPDDVLEKWLTWEGIQGYDYTILKLVLNLDHHRSLDPDKVWREDKKRYIVSEG